MFSGPTLGHPHHRYTSLQRAFLLLVAGKCYNSELNLEKRKLILQNVLIQILDFFVEA